MKRKFPFWPVFLSSAGAFIVFMTFFPPPHRERYNGYRASCQNSLRQLAAATAMYLADSDEDFPPVSLSATGPFGWAGAIEPYLKSTQAFQCYIEDRTKPSSDPRSVGFTDYWMNQRLSGIGQGRIKLPASTVLFAEGNDGHDATDARYALDSIPREWIGDPGSPSFRHLEGANYAFVDGHVKWFMAWRMTDSAKPNGSGFFPIITPP